jgi:alkaline phosphatase D
MTTTRRAFLAGSAAAGVLAGLRAGVASAGVRALDVPAATPFTLGVASGDPTPNGVVLWTRLAPDPLAGGGMAPMATLVTWQVAADERFKKTVRRGLAVAAPQLAHSVHVEVTGLEPGHDYWYRFRHDGHVSPVGRTRTLPAQGSHPSAMRLAVANCQDFQNGFWPGYAAIAADDIDFVVHVGDYIYEYDPNSRFAERRHTPPEQPGLDQLRTLADYRARYAQYKLDPTLQAAHAAHPFWVVPDDHEVENNYAGVVDEIDDTGEKHQDPDAFAAQRATAFQAYYEHMPLRLESVPHDGGIRLYRSFRFGQLAEILLLDTRQYRTDQPGGASNDFGPEAAGDGNADGTLTGPQEEAWLVDQLHGSSATWNVIGQQTMVSRTRFVAPPPNSVLNLDQWDGYGSFRQRVFDSMAASGATNLVVLSGDIHSAWVNDLRTNFDDPATTMATEFVSTSISSDFPAALIPVAELSNQLFNPHVRYFDATRRGYLRCTVTPTAWTTEIRTSATIDSAAETVTTTATWVVDAGHAGAHPA